MVSLFFAIGFLTVSYRLIDVTLLRGQDEPGISDFLSHSSHSVARFNILDRNGKTLATNLITASLYANPKIILDTTDAFEKLTKIFPQLDQKDLLKKLSSDKNFVWIARNLTPQQQALVHHMGLPGLHFHREEKRVYPHGRLVSHVLGFTDVDNRGIAGIEYGFDVDLSKNNVQLSIDLSVQHAVNDELTKTIEHFKAKGGCVLVLDAKSGEILAMVSQPNFDPHMPQKAKSEERFNANTLGIYEMGSTIKIFTTAMALETGTVTFQDGYDASNPIRVAKFSINDFRGKNRWLSVPEIFQYSSNIGMVRMAQDVGTEGHIAYLDKFGLLKPVSVEIPEVGAPLTPKQWRDINMMTISYGYGLSISPLQLAMGVGSVVNDGIMVEPTLLKRAETPEGKRIISRKTSHQMRQLLRLAVTDGTSRKANVDGYVVGGKTGTANRTDGKTYNTKETLSSFVGAFPMHDPKYVVLTMLDRPQGSAETFGYTGGGWTAAPLGANVIARIAPILGVNPVNESDSAIEDALHIDI
ncbi:MAG: penicillin-binding protein 2, partial [Alphaproteobacteria bacterium]|nr:penicillin-binding protein 2 [Alphaproteobacteria bacterium]